MPTPNDAAGRSRTIRGVLDHQDLDARSSRRDIRAPSRRFTDLLRKPAASAFIILMMALMQWAFPIMTHFAIPIALILYLTVRSTDANIVLPLRLPMSAKREDLNDPKPGRAASYMARGVFHIGNEMGSRLEIWEAAKDIVMHWLVFGATGSGKTETLLSCCMANVLSMGSGGIYSDAKAAPDLAWKIQGLARRVGRDDDFLVINYITGNRARKVRDRARSSNTSNPFAFGTADSLVQLLSSLINTPTGDNAVFGQKAIALLTAALYPLVDLRDCGATNLGVNVIRAHMNIPALMRLASDPRVSAKSKSILVAFLGDLPGFDIAKESGKQKDEVYRQFGFAVSYFTRALSSLSDTYGHIYWTDMGEVDLPDVIMNRRILVIMLPAIEKSVDELRNLGKISLAGARQALSIGLGHRLEGTKQEVLDNIPTVGRVPFIIVADEYAYQSTEGFAVTAAQARGLNVAIIFAGQDYAGFKKASAEEADQIVSNTVTKFMMALTEVADTWELFSKLGGQANVAQTQGYERDYDSPFIDYRDTGGAQIARVDRVDVRDAQEQIEGEAHIFFRGRLIRVEMFHAGITPPKEFRILRYLKVAEPDPADQQPFAYQIKAIEGMFTQRQVVPAEQVETFFDSLAVGPWATINPVMTAAGRHLGAIEQGIIGMLAMADVETQAEITGGGGGGGLASLLGLAIPSELQQQGSDAAPHMLDDLDLLAPIGSDGHAQVNQHSEPSVPRSALDVLASGGSDFDPADVKAELPGVGELLDREFPGNAYPVNPANTVSDDQIEPYDLSPLDVTPIGEPREPFPDSLAIDEDALERALTGVNAHFDHPDPQQAAERVLDAIGMAVRYPRPPPVARQTEEELLAAFDNLNSALSNRN